MFKVTIAMDDKGEFSTFREAFIVFKKELTELISGGTSQMVLDECCYINKGTGVLGTFAAIDAAHDSGILTEDGQLSEDETKDLSEDKWESRTARERNGFIKNMITNIS